MKNFTLFIIAYLAMLITVNGQLSWEAVYSMSDNTELTGVDFLDEDNGIVVGLSGTVLITADAGLNWETIDTGFDTDFEKVKYISSDSIIIVGAGGTIVRTLDGGEMWGSVPNPSDGAILFDVDVDPSTGNGIIAGSGNLIMWTEDGGTSWDFIDGGLMNNYYGAFMANGDFGITVGRNAIFQPLLGYTDNGGDSWLYHPVYPVFGSTAVEATGFDAYFFNADDGFFAGSTWNGGGFVTNEVNWSSDGWQATELPQPIYAIDFANNNLGVVAGWQGYMAETYNGGATWQEVNVSAARDVAKYNDIKLFESTGYAVTQNGAIYKRVSTTGTDNRPDGADDFLLYPNPAKKGFINLQSKRNNINVNKVKISELSGRLMKEIPGNISEISRKSLRIDTSPLIPGVYVVVIETDSGPFAKKLIVR